MIRNLKKGGTFLLNTTFSAEEIVNYMPNKVKKQLAEKNAKFYIINATHIAEELGMGRHTNTILQSAFFALNESILPYENAKTYMKEAAKKAYGKKGDAVVELNYKAIDRGQDGLVEVTVDPAWASLVVNTAAKEIKDEYFDHYVASIAALKGNDLPVSEFMKGNLLTGTMKNNLSLKEKRNIAVEVPAWDKDSCLQCGK